MNYRIQVDTRPSTIRHYDMRVLRKPRLSPVTERRLSPRSCALSFLVFAATENRRVIYSIPNGAQRKNLNLVDLNF